MGVYRAICHKSLDLQPVREHYSAALADVLCSLLVKDAAKRPSLRDVLATALLRGALEADASGSRAREDASAPIPSARVLSSTPRASSADEALLSEALSTQMLLAAASCQGTALGTALGTGHGHAHGHAHGTEAHAAASVLQCSFHRRLPAVTPPSHGSAPSPTADGGLVARVARACFACIACRGPPADAPALGSTAAVSFVWQ